MDRWMWCVFWLIVVFLFYVYLQWRIKLKDRLGYYHRVSGIFIISQQEQNIYNISGRVPNSNSAQYPDAYLSVEHIAITNELNKPPKYDDAPPSYEEALKLALAQSNSLQTFQAEQPQVHQAASSTSSSTPVVVSAIPSRTTE